MKLRLTKNQSKGVLGIGIGDVRFEVKAEVELTADESELVRHYKLENEVLVSRPLTILGKPVGDREVVVTVGNLLNGDSHKCKDLAEVIAYSEQLEEGCKVLKTYLEVASSFGGEEILDI